MWDLVSFVRRGSLRTRLLESIRLPNNPTDLAKKLNSHRPTVSKTLQDFKKRGLVKRLNPKEKNVSIYAITPKGLKVLQKIRQMK